MFRFIVLVTSLALAAPLWAADLLVIDGGNQILRYDASGAFAGTNGSVFNPGGFDRAADGTLYVGSFGFAQLNKLDAAGNNQLTVNVMPRPQKVRLGPDGNLYVSMTDQSIRRINPSNLSQINQLTDSAGAFDLRFGPDGLLYASAFGRIDAYDIATNARVDFDPSTPQIDPFGTFIGTPRDLAFGPDGDPFLINSRSIIRFDRPTRTLLGDFVPAGPFSDPNPLSLAFGPDGNLYVARDDNKIVRYDGATGAFLGTFIDDAIHLGRPVEMMFVPEPGLTLFAATAILLLPHRRRTEN